MFPSPLNHPSIYIGGYLGANLAARHPEAVKGLILLNATPFWSTRPPAGREGLWKLLPVDGTLPVPQVLTDSRLTQLSAFMCSEYHGRCLLYPISKHLDYWAGCVV